MLVLSCNILAVEIDKTDNFLRGEEKAIIYELYEWRLYQKYGSYASITALFDSPRKILRSLKKSHRLGSLQLDLVKQQ